MSSEEATKHKLRQIRDMYMVMGTPFNEDYEWGFYNGVEIALSMLEGRPAFYIDKEGKHNPQDVANYPEYFL